MVPSVGPQALLARGRPRHGLRWSAALLRHGACRLANRTAATINPALQGLTQVAQEVPAIRDLHGIRRTFRAASA